VLVSVSDTSDAGGKCPDLKKHWPTWLDTVLWADTGFEIPKNIFKTKPKEAVVHSWFPIHRLLLPSLNTSFLPPSPSCQWRFTTFRVFLGLALPGYIFLFWVVFMMMASLSLSQFYIIILHCVFSLTLFSFIIYVLLLFCKLKATIKFLILYTYLKHVHKQCVLEFRLSSIIHYTANFSYCFLS
jgi:hypothetical protein